MIRSVVSRSRSATGRRWPVTHLRQRQRKPLTLRDRAPQAGHPPAEGAAQAERAPATKKPSPVTASSCSVSAGRSARIGSRTGRHLWFGNLARRLRRTSRCRTRTAFRSPDPVSGACRYRCRRQDMEEGKNRLTYHKKIRILWIQVSGRHGRPEIITERRTAMNSGTAASPSASRRPSGEARVCVFSAISSLLVLVLTVGLVGPTLSGML
jgi:hypothetical protein